MRIPVKLIRLVLSEIFFPVLAFQCSILREKFELRVILKNKTVSSNSEGRNQTCGFRGRLD